MDRADFLKMSGNEDERIFIARLLDFIKAAEEKYCVRFTGFLDLRSQSLALDVLRLAKCQNYLFSEGAGFEERKMLAVFHEGIDDISFPVDFILVTSPMLSKLSHRDYLGTLMSLGIKREMTGDILSGDRQSFLTVHSDISDFIITSVEKIGGVGVSMKKCLQTDIPVTEREFEEKTDSVSSLRLDGIVASFANLSRAKAKELILAGLIFVDGREILKSDFTVTEGSTVSIRGKGKFILDGAVPSKKKERLHIKYRKFKG